LFYDTKKGEMLFFLHVYGRFLTAIRIRAPTIAIATIIAIAAAAMYISVGGRTVIGYGDAVATAAPTAKLASAVDGQ
jgi:hypothetical protein